MTNRLAHTPKFRTTFFGILAVAAATAVWLALGQAVWTGPSSAESAQSMSKEEFNRRVREYLLENPEVLAEAMSKLEANERIAQKKVVQTVLKTRREDVFNDKDTPVGGSPDGDVTLVEFFDYNCPYCRGVAPTIAKLKQSDPKLRIAYKEFPILGESSMFAAKAALAAHLQDKSKYIAFHDALMNHKGKLNEKIIIAVAGKAGLDVERLKADMNKPGIEEAIKKNHELARALRISGTPAFIIGDELIPGAADLATLQAAVDEARKQDKP